MSNNTLGMPKALKKYDIFKPISATKNQRLHNQCLQCHILYTVQHKKQVDLDQIIQAQFYLSTDTIPSAWNCLSAEKSNIFFSLFILVIFDAEAVVGPSFPR